MQQAWHGRRLESVRGAQLGIEEIPKSICSPLSFLFPQYIKPAFLKQNCSKTCRRKASRDMGPGVINPLKQTDHNHQAKPKAKTKISDCEPESPSNR